MPGLVTMSPKYFEKTLKFYFYCIFLHTQNLNDQPCMRSNKAIDRNRRRLPSVKAAMKRQKRSQLENSTSGKTIKTDKKENEKAEE